MSNDELTTDQRQAWDLAMLIVERAARESEGWRVLGNRSRQAGRGRHIVWVMPAEWDHLLPKRGNFRSHGFKEMQPPLYAEFTRDGDRLMFDIILAPVASSWAHSRATLLAALRQGVRTLIVRPIPGGYTGLDREHVAAGTLVMDRPKDLDTLVRARLEASRPLVTRMAEIARSCGVALG